MNYLDEQRKGETEPAPGAPDQEPAENANKKHDSEDQQTPDSEAADTEEENEA